MKRLGFIHDMMDVKVLILFVTARSNYPMTNQEIYELCYQDECLSYFDVSEHQRIDAFELWCWRRLLRVPWTARDPTSPF